MLEIIAVTLEEVIQIENCGATEIELISGFAEGGFKEVEDWKTDFEKHVGIKEKEIEDLYYWYTTCPKCAKKYNRNYVVLIAKLK